MFLLHILPETPGGYQWLNYILLMLVSNKLLLLFREYITRQARWLLFVKFILMLNIPHSSIRMNLYMWNTILFILCNRTFYNTTYILLPTILLTHCSLILHRTLQSIYLIISRCVYLGIKWYMEIALPILIMCSAFSFRATTLISNKYSFKFCASCILRVEKIKCLYVIGLNISHFGICLHLYNPIFSLSNSFSIMIFKSIVLSSFRLWYIGL